MNFPKNKIQKKNPQKDFSPWRPHFELWLRPQGKNISGFGFDVEKLGVVFVSKSGVSQRQPSDVWPGEHPNIGQGGLPLPEINKSHPEKQGYSKYPFVGVNVREGYQITHFADFIAIIATSTCLSKMHVKKPGILDKELTEGTFPRCSRSQTTACKLSLCTMQILHHDVCSLKFNRNALSHAD